MSPSPIAQTGGFRVMCSGMLPLPRDVLGRLMGKESWSIRRASVSDLSSAQAHTLHRKPNITSLITESLFESLQWQGDQSTVGFKCLWFQLSSPDLRPCSIYSAEERGGWAKSTLMVVSREPNYRHLLGLHTAAHHTCARLCLPPPPQFSHLFHFRHFFRDFFVLWEASSSPWGPICSFFSMDTHPWAIPNVNAILPEHLECCGPGHTQWPQRPHPNPKSLHFSMWAAKPPASRRNKQPTKKTNKQIKQV